MAPKLLEKFPKSLPTHFEDTLIHTVDKFGKNWPLQSWQSDAWFTGQENLGCESHPNWPCCRH